MEFFFFGFLVVVVFATTVQAAPTDSFDQPIDNDSDLDILDVSQDVADAPITLSDLSESEPPDDAGTDAFQSSSFLDAANPQKPCDAGSGNVNNKVDRSSACPVRSDPTYEDDSGEQEIEHLIKKPSRMRRDKVERYKSAPNR